MEKIFPASGSAKAQSIGTDTEHKISDDNEILLGSADISTPTSNSGSDFLTFVSSTQNTSFKPETITDFQLGSGSEVLDIQDLISDHSTTDNVGGYLQFTVTDGVVTLGIDLNSPDGSGNSTYVALATIEGASGLSGTQILNTLLANHEIKFD